MEATEFVQTFPLLRLTTPDAEPLMKYLTEVSVAPGTPVIRYGEENASIFFITEGCIDISLGGGTSAFPVGQVGRGHWVGELGLLAPDMAIAEARAVEASKLYELSNWQLQELARDWPKSASALLHAISLQLADRLRKAGARGGLAAGQSGATEAAEQERTAWLRQLGRGLMGIGEQK